MSIEPEREEFFQYATFGVLGLLLVVCLCYGLLFINPYVNPIQAMRPATPTLRVSVFSFPPTWTPTSTGTPTNTPTNMPTSTPTSTATNTPLPTNTARPTARPYQPPPAPRATQPPAGARFKQIKQEFAPNCGTWYAHGTVWDRGYQQGFVPGTLVRVRGSDGSTWTDKAGSHPNNPNQQAGNQAYWEVVFARKPVEGSGTIAIVDGNGNLLSSEYSFNLTKACKGDNAVNEVVMDFARQ